MSTKSKNEGFKKGERVQARWAGSKQFYEGKIVDVLKTVCKVQFENDGSISSVKLADIKKPVKSDKDESPKPARSKTRSRSRSAGRKKPVKSDKDESPKPARSKTRSRSRSTGRTSRSRSRSPARKAKVKRGRRPLKVEKSKKEESPEKASPKSETSPSPNNVSKDEIDTIVKPSLIREKISSFSFSPSIKLNSFLSKDVKSFLIAEETPDRVKSKRLSALRSMESTQRLLETKRVSNAKLSDKAKYSDDEEEEEEQEKAILTTKPLSNVWKVLYFLGTLMKIITVPVMLLFLIFACNIKQCTVLEIPHIFSRWSVLANSLKFPLPCVASFHLLLCLLSLIPLGKKVVGFSTVDSKKPLEYRIHGFIYLFSSALIFGICSYFGINVNWGYDKFKPIALSSLIYCFLFALILYILHAIKGDGPVQTRVPLIGKFYSGTYINPILFGKIDVKTSFIRAGLIGSVILNLSILTKYFLMKSARAALPLGLTAGMQIFFVLDLLFREEKLLSTATYNSDSVGYAFIITTGFLIPIGLSAQNVYHYMYETKTNLTPYWYYSIVGIIIILFFVGYYLYLTSSNLKHNFRRDPYGKTMLKHDSIPTAIKSKRLLVSGGWGFVRHPNYLGLLIMALAWTLPCGYSHVVPYGPLFMLTVALVLRVFRIEKECQEKYGPGWKNYTDKVRSRLIPYIF